MSTLPPQVLEFMRLVSVETVELVAFMPNGQRIGCEVDGRSCLDVAAAFVDVLEVNGGVRKVWLAHRFVDSVFWWTWEWERANQWDSIRIAGQEYPWAIVEKI